MITSFTKNITNVTTCIIIFLVFTNADAEWLRPSDVLPLKDPGLEARVEINVLVQEL